MKKLLMSIIGIILLIALVISVVKGMHIGNFRILSINQVKEKSQELDNKIAETNTEINQNYANAVNQMNTAVKRLKTVKNEYQSKIEYLSENPELGITQIEKYKIEYLWGIIGNYAKDDGLKVDLNIEETSIQDTYNINFTLNGSYIGITNFLYHIENDDELNYKVTGFNLEPTTTTTTTKSGTETTTPDTTTLKATFKVENIIINFN